MVVSLGPFGKIVSDIPNNPRSDGFGSNPRCLRRDVNKYAAAVTAANYTYALITQNNKIDDFQKVMLGTPAKNDWGVHMGGHYTIGGDPGGVSLVQLVTTILKFVAFRCDFLTSPKRTFIHRQVTLFSICIMV